jgi:hypothetical protein
MGAQMQLRPVLRSLIVSVVYYDHMAVRSDRSEPASSGCINVFGNMEHVPQGLKPRIFRVLIGAAEAAPFQNPVYATSSRQKIESTVREATWVAFEAYAWDTSYLDGDCAL